MEPLQTVVLPEPTKALFEPYALAIHGEDPDEAIALLVDSLMGWMKATATAAEDLPEGTASTSDRNKTIRKGGDTNGTAQQPKPKPNEPRSYVKAARKNLPEVQIPQPKPPAAKTPKAAPAATRLAPIAEEVTDDGAFETQRKRNRSPKKNKKQKKKEKNKVLILMS